MARLQRIAIALALVLALLLPPTESRDLLLLHWYPTYGRRLQTIVTEHCQWQMALYHSDLRPANCTESTACKIAPAIDCILDEMKESDKANMAAAAVVLGLLPTTLGLAGSTTTETGMLSLRRPLLAFLLAAGAPAVNPIRTFEYRDPLTMLRARAGTWRVPHPRGDGHAHSPLWVLATVAVQYALAGAAVANLFWVSWTMAHRTICSWAPEIGWLPVAWAFTSVGIHVAGAGAVALRMRFVNAAALPLGRRVRGVLRDEFTPSALGSASRRLQWRPEGWAFYCLSWATATGTVLHIIFGTLVFSSILFIATADAVTVAARYLASAVLCRIILNYELDGISYGAEAALDEAKPVCSQLRPRPDLGCEDWRTMKKVSNGRHYESADGRPGSLPLKRPADTRAAARPVQRA